ncbi:hypothetical protein [Streptomyces sp. NPDC059564]|uniref:hypothetical protein n=1 Tax=Streptomyces sp. NPDC059564 TaxID=3346865 RepID=UPI0036C5E735
MDETWNAEVRRDVARVLMTLRVEFAEQNHPGGRAIADITHRLHEECTAWITEARASGAIPPGPPPRQTALALLGALEGVVIAFAGQAPYDTEFADRAVRGVLGVPTTSILA